MGQIMHKPRGLCGPAKTKEPSDVMTRAWIFALTLCASLVQVAPASAQGDGYRPEPVNAKILAIGDSLMAWNGLGGRSIPQVVSLLLKEPVRSHANVGAFMIYSLPISGLMGKRIAAQYRDNDYDWVIVNGGGNDLWLGCGCRKCERRMNKMVSPDGRKGEVPDLVRRIRKSGAKVVFIGYLRSPGSGSTIEHCKNEGDAYDARLAVMAKQMDGVWFISNADIVPSGDTSYHSSDRIHPSRKGSIAIAQRVAALIRQQDKTR